MGTRLGGNQAEFAMDKDVQKDICCFFCPEFQTKDRF